MMDKLKYSASSAEAIEYLREVRAPFTAIRHFDVGSRADEPDGWIARRESDALVLYRPVPKFRDPPLGTAWEEVYRITDAVDALAREVAQRWADLAGTDFGVPLSVVEHNYTPEIGVSRYRWHEAVNDMFDRATDAEYRGEIL